MEQDAAIRAGRYTLCAIVALGVATVSCTTQNAAVTPALSQSATRVSDPMAASGSPITHVVIIFQENRTPDNLFQGVKGADIATYAIDSRGKRVPLRPVSLQTRWDLFHGYKAFLADYDGGKMDGFDTGLPPQFRLHPFGYAPESEVKPYHEMARIYAFADHMFQSNEGPSFPAHLYIVSGTATDPAIAPNKVVNNPHEGATGDPVPGGCDAVKTAYVETIDPRSGAPGPTPFPCFERPVLSDFLDAKGVSWRYYQQHRGAGRWNAMDAYRHVRYGPDYKNVVWPSDRVLTDISDGRLAQVSWVMPAAAWSDHAGRLGGKQGPSWVAAIVNALGKSKYWKSTAIFVTWDDWGGWYDHVKPPIKNHYELGFRVPLVVVSPYAKRGYVSKREHEFGSILAFTEETFGIPKGALHTTDGRADDLMDAFDLTQRPTRFSPIQAPPFVPGPNAGIVEDDQ